MSNPQKPPCDCDCPPDDERDDNSSCFCPCHSTENAQAQTSLEDDTCAGEMMAYGLAPGSY